MRSPEIYISKMSGMGGSDLEVFFVNGVFECQMMRSYWFSPGGFASAEPASSSAPKNGFKSSINVF